MKQATVLASLVLVVLASLMFAGASDSAAADKIFKLSTQTYRQVLKAREFMAAENYSGAELVLLKLKNNVRNSDYDQVEILRTLGYLYALQEDYTKAISAFQAAMATEKISTEVRQELRFNLAQVYISLANNYSQEGEYARVIPPAKQGIRLSSKPAPSWYQLLLQAHFELKQYAEAVTILEKLVRLYPDTKSYWSQLASMQLEQQKDAEALAVLEVMYRKGMYQNESEYVRLADFLAYRNNPLRAGKVYENALNRKIIRPTASAWRKLAVFWRLAREPEQAIAAYEAALKSEADPDTQIELLMLLAEREKHGKVIALADVLSGRADEKQKGRALLLKGQALYEQSKLAEALDVMRKAARLKDSSVEAGSWVNFLSDSLESANLL